MPAVLNKLVTIEDFVKLPEPADGSREELLRGEVITMPPPQSRHGLIQLQIGFLLKSVIGPKKLGWVMTETGVVVERDPDSFFGPDVVFWSIRRVPQRPERYLEIPPDLVVEVLSPDDRKAAVRGKIRDYLKSGVKLVWLVDPDVQTVTVYEGSMRGIELDEDETITGGDVLPEFSSMVAEFFE
jgi:Uma2 family endonuclease